MWLEEIVDMKPSDENGRKVVVGLKTDSVPSTFPTTGEDIEGLLATDTIEKGSYIYVIDTGEVYMRKSTGEWVKQ